VIVKQRRRAQTIQSSILKMQPVAVRDLPGIKKGNVVSHRGVPVPEPMEARRRVSAPGSFSAGGHHRHVRTIRTGISLDGGRSFSAAYMN